LISTPIGNLNDITLRGLETIFKVDILLCEDSRVTGNLVHQYKEKFPQYENYNPKLISYHDHNEERMNPQILDWLQTGKNVGLVTDAGTPLISDPGYKLVRDCFSKNIKVESIPGSSSVLTALTLSSFPPDKFMFIGYLPRKSGQRQNLFKNLHPKPFKHITVIAFESPHRIISSLKDMKQVLGDIEVCVCRELTKMYEEIKKGKVSEVTEYFEKKSIKGEIVLLFEVS